MPLLPQRNGPHLGASTPQSGEPQALNKTETHSGIDSRKGSRAPPSSLAGLPPAGRRSGSGERFSLSFTHTRSENPAAGEKTQRGYPPARAGLPRESRRPQREDSSTKVQSVSPQIPSLLSSATVFSHPVHATFASQLRAPSRNTSRTRVSSSLGHLSPVASLDLSGCAFEGQPPAPDPRTSRGFARGERDRASPRERRPGLPPHTQDLRRAGVSSSPHRSPTPSYLNPTVSSRQRSLSRRSEEPRSGDSSTSRSRSTSKSRERPARSSQRQTSPSSPFALCSSSTSSLSSSALRLSSVSATPGGLPPLPPACRSRPLRGRDEEGEGLRQRRSSHLESSSRVRSSSEREWLRVDERASLASRKTQPQRPLGETPEAGRREERPAERRSVARKGTEWEDQGERTEGKHEGRTEAREATCGRRSAETAGWNREARHSAGRDVHPAKPRLSSSSVSSRKEECAQFETPWALGPPSTPRRRSSSSSFLPSFASCSSRRTKEGVFEEMESRPRLGDRSSSSQEGFLRDEGEQRESGMAHSERVSSSAAFCREDAQPRLSASSRFSSSGHVRGDAREEAGARPFQEYASSVPFSSSLRQAVGPPFQVRRSSTEETSAFEGREAVSMEPQKEKECEAENLLRRSSAEETSAFEGREAVSMEPQKEKECEAENLSSSSWLESDPLFRELSARDASAVRELPVDLLLADDEPAAPGAQSPKGSPRGRQTETGVFAAGDSRLFLSQQHSDDGREVPTRSGDHRKDEKAETGERNEGRLEPPCLSRTGENRDAWGESTQAVRAAVAGSGFFSLFSRQTAPAEREAHPVRNGEARFSVAAIEAEKEADVAESGGREQDRETQEERADNEAEGSNRMLDVSPNYSRRSPGLASSASANAVRTSLPPASSSGSVSRERSDLRFAARPAYPSSLPPPPKRGSVRAETLASLTGAGASSLIPKARPASFACPATQRLAQPKTASKLSFAPSSLSSLLSSVSASSAVPGVVGRHQRRPERVAEGSGAERRLERTGEARLVGRLCSSESVDLDPDRDGNGLARPRPREGASRRERREDETCESGECVSPTSSAGPTREARGRDADKAGAVAGDFFVSSFCSLFRRPLGNGAARAPSVADAKGREKSEVSSLRLWRRIARRTLTILLLLCRVLTSSYDSLVAHGGVRGIIATLDKGEKGQASGEKGEEKSGEERRERGEAGDRGEVAEEQNAAPGQGGEGSRRRAVERKALGSARGYACREGRREEPENGSDKSGKMEEARHREAERGGRQCTGVVPAESLASRAQTPKGEKGNRATDFFSLLVCRRREGEKEVKESGEPGAGNSWGNGTGEEREDASGVSEKETRIQEIEQASGRSATTDRASFLSSPLFYVAVFCFLGAVFSFLTQIESEDEFVDLDVM
ncbi:conserved hypothetical protein [Neospora caninum Liverpool]|uniref:Transmembrane protein n=1 Tax=Neospora caninum (strain Liverpool) TaxID=572307 RepID=F0VDB8_NEOCL|nr:conserved hypothetical protein [Neospora caninum Liverpool]CBZ51633.1 conserved hypothetical protein [Neospora caninum Liverpool]CEL65587.1 TPA: hypothetical protein BN1204_014270 [Neospora caninum Liverpool]|eukprot:XP_003881666.1 conserved hypothetical protein [Neospora caninum Liverpool]